jgi:dephospho-CoA kinase
MPAATTPSSASSADAQRPLLAVAITGGIGAGKSETLKAFARHGAAVVSSDEIAHRLLQEDRDVRDAIRARWGDGVFNEHGDVDRESVAEIVFADRDELDWLEGLLHPRVILEYLEWRDELARRPDSPALCVTEVPLLYEVGGETRFDVVVAVTAPDDVRAERGRAAADREARLIPDEEKVARADFAYVNDGSLEELDAFVAEVVAALRARG